MAQDKEEEEMTLDKLAQLVAHEIGGIRNEMARGFEEVRNEQDELARMVASGFAEFGSALNGRMDKLEAKMDQHFTESDDRLLHSERTAAKAINLAIDLQEDVTATSTAVEQDGLRVIDHERRIVALEAAVV